MVGERGQERSYNLEEILTDNQIHCIIGKVLKDDKFVVVGASARPANAAGGIAGFLAEHIRAELRVRVQCADRMRWREHTLALFLKRIPVGNKPKADFIYGNNYFKRENLIFRLLEEIGGGEGPNPWCARSFLNTDRLVVMPDLAQEGYVVRPLLEPLDLAHALLTAAAIARFHAAFADYVTDRTADASAADRPYDFHQEFGHLLTETTFRDTPWVRAAAKLTGDFLNTFSTKYRRSPALEETLARLFVAACESLDRAEGTLNVVLHKDLWINNIMYRYENGQPTNALLIDYQCVRYGPPAFDVTAFLYLTTTRAFREAHESQVFGHYFATFTAALKDGTRKRLDAMNYDEEEFLRWCERSRMFGQFEAIAILPQVLMDARAAEQAFDDPDTFMRIVEEDRSGPVLAYAHKHPLYRDRNLEVSEEFVERYVIPNP